MGKDPAFLFYPGDWLGGTLGMTLEEKGAYLELLVMQWNCHRIAEADATRVVGEKNWNRLIHKFTRDENGLFFNERLDLEKMKRNEHSAKQKQNALKRWHKTGISEGIAVAMPLENENENSIKVLNNKKEHDDFSDEYFSTLFDDITIGDYAMAFRHIDVPAEFEKFKLKVRKAPNEYKTRDTGGMRFAFQYHLSRVKVSPTPVKTQKLTMKDLGL